MRRISLHGIGVDVAVLDTTDPFGRFFDFFPAREPSSADLVIEVREGDELLDLFGYQPVFFHGRVQAYEGPSGLLVTDGKTHARLSKNGTILDIRISRTNTDYTEGVVHVALTYALRKHRFFELHAAAIATPNERPIVICGDSGAGKTTLLLAFVAAGFAWLGDDRLLLHRETGEMGEDLPRAYAYPRVFHVGPKTVAAFPELASNVGPSSGGDKRNFEPATVYSSSFEAGGRPPALLLFPRIAGGPRTHRVPFAQAEAFGQLLMSSAILAVEGMPLRDENLSCLRDLVAHVPAFEVLLGDDLLVDPGGVARALLDASADHGPT